ncbi:actin interacting protein 3-domain-containing protein [Sphaerosporella brunnea]|uniref:Actin interacting protein 3-domain-containing protein n=1 Tax=Sphaerosporella brunnea TaxID=1250544 RepID=A0A5J5EIV0_9PEZI|nr:actin interacting protein 3-domain-containing protein [Sphaerosporella brunnea]
MASSVRTSGGGGGTGAGGGGDAANGADDMTPPRTSSLPQRNSPPASQGSVRGSTGSRSSHQHTASASSVIPASNPPPPPDSTPPYPTPENPPSIAEPIAPSPTTYTVPPPPPTPPTQDALAALQQHSSLERRASRRYSAYQIAKLTGKSTNDVPVLPTRDPSAIPRNRESMDAVQKRHSRVRSMNRSRKDSSPINPNRIAEEREKELDAAYSPVVRTPDERVGPAVPAKDERQSLHVDTNVSTHVAHQTIPEEQIATITTPEVPLGRRSRSVTPSDVKEMTLFLQLGRSIKKVTLDSVDDLSLTSLRLLFISKFNYNPPSGDDFPEIYLQDPVSGVRYELEDLRDVKDRAVLCLNVEVLDEVKRHIDDGLDGLKKIVQNLAGSVEKQGVQMTRVVERQEEAAKKIAELSVAPPIPAPVPAANAGSESPSNLSPDEAAAKLNEVRDLRRDLAVLRQVFSTFVADMNGSMSTVKAKADAVKQVATTAVTGGSEGRTYVEKGKAQLGADADNLVTKVDDLQDTVEDLRKDVVMRGVRPLPRQLETVSKEIALAKAELKKMADYIKREKPLFRRVWERELEVVCEEQEFFSMQESLVNDLEDDLDKASQTFVLVEQCSAQQLNNGGRNASRNFPPLGVMEDLDPSEVKGSLLNEVRALQPNHETRLEAIERAEKLRQKELEGRVAPFQKELGEFVEERKLRKTGGVEEAERLRLSREEQARKEVWEHKKQMEEEEEEESDEDDDEYEEDDDEAESGEEEGGANGPA